MESFLSSSKQNKIIQKINKLYFQLKVLYENRYCNQDDFSILVCGGMNNNYRYQKSVFKLNGSEFEYKHYALMPYARKICKTAVINSELFVLGGYTKNYTYDKSFRKFCIKNKTWSLKTQQYLNDNRFCLCSFKKNLYIVNETSFFLYNLKNDQWTQKAKMNQTRNYAACTVFEGKIVVTGGVSLKSVEAYDYYENKWNYLSDMIKKRYHHSSVSMGNKMFVVGGGENTDELAGEVFDSFSRKFTYISYATIKGINQYKSEALCVCNKIIVFF